MLQFPKLLLPGLIPCDNYYLMPGTAAAGAAPAIQLNYIPIWISSYCKVIEIGFNVTTLSATNKAKVGIYEYDLKTSDPTNLLVAGAAEIIFSATGYRFITINISLDPGIYYIGYVIKDGTGQIRPMASIVDYHIPNKLLSGATFARTMGKRSLAAFVYGNEMSSIAPGPFLEFVIGNGVPNPILRVRTV